MTATEHEDPWADVPPPPDPFSVSTASDTSWRPVDLAAILAADHVPTVPTIGERSDGRGVLYPGRSHTCVGESEAAKSWFAQFIAVQEMGRGRGVVYLDFEDDAEAVTKRMLTLGAVQAWLLDQFAYISPSEPLGVAGGLRDLEHALGDLNPSFVVIDGVTEALSLHGLSTNDNDEIARFGRTLIRPITATGAASLSLDHVTKNAEGRGRYAIGGVHKLNAVTGAAFILENVARFGQDLAGRSRLLIAKDRPGHLRARALPGSGDRWWYADFTLDAAQQPEPADLATPHVNTQPFRPTALMAKVSDALTGAPHPLTTNDITARVKGKATDIRTAIAALVDTGHITVTNGTRGARLHTLTTPYPEGPE
ncbi:MAG: helicase RepA family protein [Actinomycetota bacterium]|nr:helicase RepA family protein [Actinomycetota bacterium]